MKAIVQHGFGDLGVLSYFEVPDPVPARHEVLVRVEACALNRLDVLQRNGPALLPGFSLPHIAGMDVAGTVVATGADVTAPRIGDRVLLNPALECGRCARCRAGDDGLCPDVEVIGATRAGGYGELCAAPADHAFVLPESVGVEEAATVPTVFSTAWHALVSVGRLRIGETLLVTGPGSGVTIAAIQLGVRCGARVIVAGRSREKLELARRLGAAACIVLGEEDLAGACRELTGGAGADIALDHLGPSLFQPTIHALRPRGRLVFCGTTTGTTASFDLAFAYHFGISLLGADPYPAREFRQMLEFYWRGRFEPVIDSRFALSDAAAAQARMERGDACGKILLLP